MISLPVRSDPNLLPTKKQLAATSDCAGCGEIGRFRTKPDREMRGLFDAQTLLGWLRFFRKTSSFSGASRWKPWHVELRFPKHREQSLERMRARLHDLALSRDQEQSSCSPDLRQLRVHTIRSRTEEAIVPFVWSASSLLSWRKTRAERIPVLWRPNARSSFSGERRLSIRILLRLQFREEAKPAYKHRSLSRRQKLSIGHRTLHSRVASWLLLIAPFLVSSSSEPRRKRGFGDNANSASL